LEKEGEKKENANYYNKGYSYLITHPSTNPAEQGLTLLSGRNMLLSYAEHTSLNFQGEKKYQKEKKISEIGWESKEQKIRGI